MSVRTDELTKKIRDVEWKLETWLPSQLAGETHARRLASLRRQRDEAKAELSHLVTELSSAVQEEAPVVEKPKSFGPQQQGKAKLAAENVWLWGIEAVQAVERNDVERVAQLAQAMAEASQYLVELAGRASR